jgi:hypothetical protein
MEEVWKVVTMMIDDGDATRWNAGDAGNSRRG